MDLVGTEHMMNVNMEKMVHSNHIKVYTYLITLAVFVNMKIVILLGIPFELDVSKQKYLSRGTTHPLRILIKLL